jgi:type IV pilus assembly protein PilV
VLVLAVGLLGLATMQAQGLKSNSSAEKRTEATFLAMDIMDRMRASMTPGSPPAVNAAFNNIDAHSGALYSCGTCSVVEQDIQGWVSAVGAQLGGDPQGGGANSNAWRAQVSQTGVGGVYMITLMWDDERTGAGGTGCGGDPDVDMTCFQTLFQP